MRSIMRSMVVAMAAISLVSCGKSENTENAKNAEIVKISAIEKVAAQGALRILCLENRDTLYSRSKAAFAALPGDTLMYRKKGNSDWTLTVFFAKDHGNLPEKEEKKSSGSVFFVPIYR